MILGGEVQNAKGEKSQNRGILSFSWSTGLVKKSLPL